MIQVYSNGQSEIVLGNAIKKLNLPREELVIMTKVYNPVPSSPAINLITLGKKPEEIGIINQHGLNRKVSRNFCIYVGPREADASVIQSIFLTR